MLAASFVPVCLSVRAIAVEMRCCSLLPLLLPLLVLLVLMLKYLLPARYHLQLKGVGASRFHGCCS